MSLFVNAFFEERLQDFFNLAARVEKAFGAAGIEYRVVGGLAAYLYVEEAEADAGRLTKDKLATLDVPASATAYVCGPWASGQPPYSANKSGRSTP